MDPAARPAARIRPQGHRPVKAAERQKEPAMPGPGIELIGDEETAENVDRGKDERDEADEAGEP